MKKKLVSMALATALCASTVLAGCGNTSTSGAKDSYTIGICQIVQHVALDEATKGFKDCLTEKLGDKVTFDYQDAAGDSATCATIVNGFVSNNYDLILANATAPLQAAATATTTIPVLGTSVTDYATALEIADWNGSTGYNVSGTSDLAPLPEQAAMIKEIFPDCQIVGILYCSAEPNSKYQADVISSELASLGMTAVTYSFADSNDIALVCQQACDASDVIYIPTDNTAASCTGTIDSVASAAGVPIVAGEEGICKGCGVATLSISYYDLGYATGEMAYDILVNGADITTMKVQYAPNVTKEYVAERCDALGITIPDGYTAITVE
ncbi:MAG: ABC transporter substrate-binding protein [Lachnospiraceae bacterium]|nr:ABC transporter substrate-binding protein [Lachnospiraceae bacterium]